eukprot:850542-Rhodomonas_salina.1
MKPPHPASTVHYYVSTKRARRQIQLRAKNFAYKLWSRRGGSAQEQNESVVSAIPVCQLALGSPVNVAFSNTNHRRTM